MIANSTSSSKSLHCNFLHSRRIASCTVVSTDTGFLYTSAKKFAIAFLVENPKHMENNTSVS